MDEREKNAIHRNDLIDTLIDLRKEDKHKEFSLTDAGIYNHLKVHVWMYVYDNILCTYSFSRGHFSCSSCSFFYGRI